MSETDQAVDVRANVPEASRSGFVGFAVALAIVAATGTMILWIGWVEKRSIPWPEGIEVDEHYRTLSMPEQFGHYRMLSEDDPSYRNGEQQAGADIIFPEDQLATLGFGTAADERRWPERRSGWYGARLYEDQDIQDTGSPYRQWQAFVYYYTGIRDSVPHVGEICIRAGGGRILSAENVLFNTPADLEGDWADGVTFRRVYADVYGQGGVTQKSVEYYVFSVNGEPVTDRVKTRFMILDPRVRHCYFAKIQFRPVGGRGIESIEQADRAAQEFVRNFLPAVLKMLPTAETIKRLDKGLNNDAG